MEAYWTERGKVKELTGLVGRTFSVEVTGLGYAGEGVGRLPPEAGEAWGKTCFIPGALPGERVLAEVTEEHRRYVNAVLKAVERISPDRVTPACPLFGLCGGCGLQHLDYRAQLRWKRQLVVDALTHLGGIEDPPVVECVGMENPRGYRNKVQMPVARGESPTTRLLGFYQRGTHRVVDVSSCLVQPDLGNDLAARIRELLEELQIEPYDELSGTGQVRHVLIRVARRGGEALVVVVTRQHEFPQGEQFARKLAADFPELVGVVQNINPRRGNVILGPEERVLWGRSYFHEVLEVGGLARTFRISARSFFQVNSEQAERLIGIALAAAQLQGEELAMDLFCGAGTFALFLAAYAREVIGIEETDAAVADGKINARLNGTTNIRFLAGRVEELLPRLAQRLPERPAVVLLDPPRAGVEAPALAVLRQLAPSRIVYVSCNPATLARDLRFLLAKETSYGSHYRLVKVTPVDMFPHTAHVECVALMSRVENQL
ncbi:MAG: 23S rRNA (uracil(1939)-C(5))-methyltransferase RlmD [Limnochordales bacterium]|nr:23S rRNA (uracil(1939)-C(5))-methyltransferase RlmD [Limnochordales bacterium]